MRQSELTIHEHLASHTVKLPFSLYKLPLSVHILLCGTGTCSRQHDGNGLCYPSNFTS